VIPWGQRAGFDPRQRPLSGKGEEMPGNPR
jgi:hypothetical protein